MDDIEEALRTAEAAMRHAEDTRVFHRRRTKRGSSQREKDLATATDRIKSAMVPLRSYMGKKDYLPQTQANLAVIARVRAASDRLQRERRKLWKMQKREHAR